MKRILLGFVLFIINFSLSAQLISQTDGLDTASRRDFRDVWREWKGKDAFTFLEQKQRDTANLYFSILPAIAANGSDKGFVTTIMSVFYLGNKQTTNLSTIYLTPYFTFSNQYVLPLRYNIWTKNNGFNITGDYRLMRYPQIQFDIYEPSKNDPEFILDYYQLRFYQTVSKGIYPNLAVGIGLQYDYYYNIKEKPITGVEPSTKPTSYQNYQDSTYKNLPSGGPTIELVYDDRRNTIEPYKGNFLRSSFRQNISLSANSQLWNSITIDARKYIPLNKNRRQMIALWALYWSISSGKPYYLDMPSNGWDNYGKTGRGQYRNRYRSTSMYYLEAEYRANLTQNGLWGMVAFCNLVSPSVLFKSKFQIPHLAGGAGLRLKIDKVSGTKVGFDVALSEDYWTYYLSLNEYF